MAGKRLQYHSGTLTKKQMKLIKLIDECIFEIEKALDAHKKSIGNDGTPKQLEQIRNEVAKMKTVLDSSLYIPSFPRIIADSWDFNSRLGLKLLKLADEYKKLTN